MTTPDHAHILTGLLAAAQLAVSADEEATFVRDYQLVRGSADSLYLPELEFDEPAVRFDPLDFYPDGPLASGPETGVAR